MIDKKEEKLSLWSKEEAAPDNFRVDKQLLFHW